MFTCCSDIPPTRLPDQSVILSAQEFINVLYPGLDNEESNWESSEAEASESTTTTGDGVDYGHQVSLTQITTPSGERMLLHTPAKQPLASGSFAASSPMSSTNGTPTVMARPASSAMSAGDSPLPLTPSNPHSTCILALNLSLARFPP